MRFIKLNQYQHPSPAFLNIDFIVSVMTVHKSQTESWTRVWTTAIEEGHENCGSSAFTIDTDEALEVVMEKILQASLNHK